MRLKRPSRTTVEFAVIGTLTVLTLAIGVLGYARELVAFMFD